MARIGLYIIFAGVASVALCIWVFSSLGNQNSNSKSPRLNFMPSPDDGKSTLIRLQTTNKTNYEKWTSKLVSFLDVYYDPSKLPGGTKNMVACSYQAPSARGEFCHVRVDELQPCVRENYFDYQKGAPCVFLKLDMINGWVPEYYTWHDDLPEEMPEQLKNRIRENTTPDRNLWVSCQGENPPDVEYMGPVEYLPSIQGFPAFYFPYENTTGYMSPLVAVHFKRPTTGVVINVECKAWAKNIKHDREDGSGLVHFELLIE